MVQQQKKRVNKYRPKRNSTRADIECGRKKQFKFEAGALAYAYRRGKELDTVLHAYECTWCKHWHVGHKKS